MHMCATYNLYSYGLYRGDMTPVDASIIILTKNGGDNFPRLLERMYSQQYQGSFEVIVIDSGSTDDTLATAKKYPIRLEQIPPEQFHHGRTRNLGAELAVGQYLVYITQDALPLDDNWLQNLTTNFNDPQVAMVVGRQIPWESTKPPEKFFYYFNFPEFRLVVKSSADDYYHDNVFISNVNAAYRKDILFKIRFNDDIVMAEDKMIAAHILSDGGTIIYEPLAAVYHAHDLGIREAFNKSLDYGLALRQGASSLAKSRRSLAERTGAYLAAEIKFLNQKKCWHWLPYALVYETTKYTGHFLGNAGLAKGSMYKMRQRTHD